MNGSRLEGEVKDLQSATAFTKKCVVEGSTTYDVTEGSDLVIVTAGAKQKVGESRLDLLEKNTFMMRDVLGKILEYSPNTPICIVSKSM